ncbi:hypothetical protein PR202_gb25713 [Eleusine coracana subsp. coracana]|uniref:NB-ARC domain-containing protein n=1 Tax=Eleusine coracana subsp. coracana TaxID=191504 RepID=A0AAV5FPV7_ELECO|nr:hypothetical protein PR202_gb25713 [Eleusine coracana subsp. coracana]
MGKTTLAGLVYNDSQSNKYDHRVWVYVSQEFDLKKIGNSIISQLQREGQYNIGTLQLINQWLDDLFAGNKILIVLDDLWEEKEAELGKLQRMLHVGKKGSLIHVVVTTRNEGIAKKICTNEPYMLQPLKDDMCWNIIKKFSQLEQKASKAQFEQIGMDLANKCGGVALAAQALGCMLKSCDLHRWSEVNNSDMWTEFSKHETSPHNTVLPSLKLSYESMPPNLRLCFAYCAIFTKGRDIVKYDLIHQWIALDFIEPSMRLGEQYLNQLLGMSFLHHSKLPPTSQKEVVRYTMHDLVHDLARSVMGDELTVYDTRLMNHTSQQKYCRGCSSLVFPPSIGHMKQLSVEGVLSAVRSLTALQHLNVSNLTLPLEEFYVLGNLTDLSGLTNLEHLDLSMNGNLGCLPGDLGILKNLHTLNLRGCKNLVSLPESIDALRLKSLLVDGCPDELTDHINSRFNYLLTLPLFKVRFDGSDAHSNLHQLEHVNPDHLKIRFLENVRFLEEANTIKLSEKNNLMRLALSWNLDTDRFLEDKNLLEALLPPRGLKHFWLDGYSSLSLPTWLMCAPNHLSNLVSITLVDFPMCFYLPTLGQLPNLEYLRLDNLCRIKSVDGDFCAGKGAFRRLSRFDLTRMEGLEYWETTYHDEDGVDDFMFPMLDELNTMSCPILSLKPCPPTFRVWRIANSDEVIEGHNISQPSFTRCTRLHISSNCKSGGWKLLRLLPALQELTLIDCPNLMALPECMQHLSLLRSLELIGCQSISALPEWIDTLESLEILSMAGCKMIKSLPPSIQQLTRLQTLCITCNPELEQWCESEENKTKLAHIKDIVSALTDINNL